MRDVKYYEEVLKNLYASLETIKDLTSKADDSNWLTVMDNIETTAKRGLAFINTCTDYQKFDTSAEPFPGL